MGICGRAYEFTLSDFVTQFQRALTTRANTIGLSCDGVDSHPAARRACYVPAVSSPNQCAQYGQCGCGERQTAKTPLKTAGNRLHPPVDAVLSVNGTAVSIGTAGYTLPKMIFHDQRASRRQLVLMESWQQRTNIRAATDGLPCVGCGFLA